MIASIIIGFLCALLSDALKKLTEHYEASFFKATQVNWLLCLVFPVLGLSLIHILRHYLFRKKENKGIKEVLESLKTRHNELPMYKIPSHFLNGLITVVSGGSTGIEVSTVVASATVGSVTQKKEGAFKKFKSELICAGIAAGITALFNSPVAGVLFSLEVISKKLTKAFIIATSIAVATAFGFNYVLNEEPLFIVQIVTWHFNAIPYFLLLGIVAGLNSVYLTKSVLFFKKKFAAFQSSRSRIIIGSVIISASILLFPQLYGEGYHAVKELLYNPNQHTFTFALALTLLSIILLKPLVTSVTLASGGDGGVFAPSLFIGAFLGLLVATFLNSFCYADVIPLNFMVIGMAAMLSACIHAPFTAVFLVCGLTDNYTLVVPILLACLVSKITAKLIYPYTVYTYVPAIAK
ncbi:MAG: chloride channel protein [Bacteroidota bacterium]